MDLFSFFRIFYKIGHRGAMGYEPENTLLSFKRALDLGVDMVELDVHLCKTGELVVIHDEKIDKTTNGKGYVGEKTLEEIKILDAGKGEKIPTLLEVFDLVGKKAKINIELKGKGTAEPVSKIIDYYIKEKCRSKNNFLVSSFDYEELEKFKKINPKIKTGIIFDKLPENWLELAKRLGVYSINLNIKLINHDIVRKARGKWLKVFVWTVNDPQEIKRMKNMGVSAIFSNFPDRI